MRFLQPLAILIVGAIGAASAEAGELYDAALANDLASVSRLVSRGADLNDPGDLGSPLHVAVFQGNVAMVTLLLDRGADIEDTRNSNGYHPLHRAVSYDQPEIAALLLKRGAQIDARDSQDRTPLHMAAGEGSIAVGTILLENGADANIGFGGSGFTALHASAYRDSAEFAKLLLSHNANPNAAADGTTPLHLGAAQGSPELVEVLIAGGADVNARDKAGATPITLAHGNVQKGTIEVLLKHGAKQ